MPEKATPMKLKTITVTVDGKELTVAVLDDKGHPVYVHDDGKEIGFDAALATSTIAARNAEAKTNRERAEAAEAKLKPFEGIEDAEAARQAVQTVANLNSGELKTAAQVQEIKDAAKKAAEEQVAAAIKASGEQITQITKERDDVTAQFHAELIGGGFARSKFIADKIAIPADIMQATFGKAFKIEEGKLVAYDASGAKIISRARPGDFADLDEALEVLVNAYPNRDAILKGTVGAGGGAGGGGGKRDGATMTRTQFNALSPQARAEKAKDMSAGKLTLVDDAS